VEEIRKFFKRLDEKVDEIANSFVATETHRSVQKADIFYDALGRNDSYRKTVYDMKLPNSKVPDELLESLDSHEKNYVEKIEGSIKKCKKIKRKKFYYKVSIYLWMVLVVALVTSIIILTVQG
jgi:hypothetical protein